MAEEDECLFLQALLREVDNLINVCLHLEVQDMINLAKSSPALLNSFQRNRIWKKLYVHFNNKTEGSLGKIKTRLEDQASALLSHRANKSLEEESMEESNSSSGVSSSVDIVDQSSADDDDCLIIDETPDDECLIINKSHDDAGATENEEREVLSPEDIENEICQETMEAYINMKTRWQVRNYTRTRSNKLETIIDDERDLMFHLSQEYLEFCPNVNDLNYTTCTPSVGLDGKICFSEPENNTERRRTLFVNESFHVILHNFSVPLYDTVNDIELSGDVTLSIEPGNVNLQWPHEEFDMLDDTPGGELCFVPDMFTWFFMHGRYLIRIDPHNISSGILMVRNEDMEVVEKPVFQLLGEDWRAGVELNDVLMTEHQGYLACSDAEMHQTVYVYHFPKTLKDHTDADQIRQVWRWKPPVSFPPTRIGALAVEGPNVFVGTNGGKVDIHCFVTGVRLRTIHHGNEKGAPKSLSNIRISKDYIATMSGRETLTLWDKKKVLEEGGREREMQLWKEKVSDVKDMHINESQILFLEERWSRSSGRDLVASRLVAMDFFPRKENKKKKMKGDGDNTLKKKRKK